MAFELGTAWQTAAICCAALISFSLGVALTRAMLRDRARTRDAALPEPEPELAERRYRSLTETLPHLAWTATADGALDYGNARWKAYTGLPLEELLGTAWVTIIHPDDVANCTAVWSRAVAASAPYEIEYRLRRADGAYRWHLGRAQPICDASGRSVSWLGTCTDIDDQKRASDAAARLDEQMRLNATLRASEERFRQVEEHAPIGLALVALDGSFLSVNPALCDLLGYTRDDLVATRLRDLTHPADVECSASDAAAIRSGAIAFYRTEKRYRHRDGRTIATLLNVSCVRDDAGTPLYFIVQIQDMTARVAAERVIASAQAAAQEATEIKARFLTRMSHEIRTPMNGIIGMAELLSLSKLSDEQSDYVRVVRDSGHALVRVVNDILDYSKFEAGKLALAISDFDLLGQMRSVGSLLEPRFALKRVALSMDVDDAVPPILNGDPGRIRQILVNLVANALAYTDAGGSVRVMVISEPRGPGVTLRFAVVDTGIGIDPASHERLFQPFSQIDGRATHDHGGTGLGLSICKQLVGLMGGDIGVQSEPGRGSSFWFTLPLGIGTVAESEPAAGKREGTDAVAPAAIRAERVLLAEDNEINTRLAVRQFMRLGFRVTAVTNGRDALHAVAASSFDMIFMDCHMPEMDGYDATRAIRALPSDASRRVPIVAMTANAQREDREACFAAGMDDFIAKPATLADIRRALERWLPLPERASREA